MRRDALLIALVLVAVVLGAWVRTNGADRRWVWQDEVTTMLHVAGRTGRDVGAAHPGTMGELAAQLREPAAGGPSRVVAALAAEDAQHPPLYYLGQRLWNDAGGTAFGRRSFSIVLGGLAVLAVGWFAFVLSGARAAAFSVALAAVSPFLVLYGQQMREYGLWCALVAASSAALVLAARRGGLRAWALYAALSAAALWTSPLSLLLAPAQAIYAAYAGGRARLVQCAAAYAAALAAFAPWIAVMYGQRAAIAASNAWSSTPYPAASLAAKMLFTAASSFTDLAYAHRLGIVAGAVVLAAIAAAAVSLARDQRATAVALGAIAATTALLPFVLDIVAGSHRSSSSRYLGPLVIAIVVAAGSVLARMRPRFAAPAAALLILTGAASSAIATSSPVWWDNHGDSGLIGIGSALVREGSPALVYDGSCADILGLARIASPAEPVRCGADARAARPPAGSYVLSPSPALSLALASAGLAAVPVLVGRDESAAARSFQRDRGASGAEPVLTRIERRR
ncbi:MAG: hypothetical protein JWM87_4762 [Candidatus Eremiobacteraeota bacterium]|nr:hypothetical protein [Candidatus Eremiobacteraeota bacterium]